MFLMQAYLPDGSNVHGSRGAELNGTGSV